MENSSQLFSSVFMIDHREPLSRIFMQTGMPPVLSFVLVSWAAASNYHTCALFSYTTTEIYSLIILEARIKKSTLWQNCTPSRSSRMQSVPWVFQLLVAASILWFVAILLQFLPLSWHWHPCICLYNFPPPLSYQDIGPRVHLGNTGYSHYLKIFKYICKYYFSK